MRTSGKDKEILKELREITKAWENRRDRMDDVADKLNEEHSAAVKAKVLWLLGEMGLRYPMQAEAYIEG